MKFFTLLSFIGVFIISFGSFAQSELTKTVSEKYLVGASDALDISNKYGKVEIITWNNNEITVDVTIKAWGRNNEQAQKLLDRVEIRRQNNAGFISFRTELSDWDVHINERSGFEINYKIQMPKGLSLSVINKFGNTYLDNHEGKLKLDIGYGRLQARKILGASSNVKVSYGSAEIEEIREGELESKYSKPVNIEKVGKLFLDDKYGGVEINEADEIDAHSSYSGLEINILNKSLFVDSKYGSCYVRQVKSSFTSIDADADYGSVTIGFEESASFDFHIKTRYGGFSGGPGLTYRREIEDNTSKEYEGYKGTQGKAKVKVTSGYGSVKFR
jgi:hypothetical protein